MKKLFPFLLILSLSLGHEAFAQAPKNVTMSQVAATRGQISESLSFGTGKTGSFLFGSTLSIAGTLSGTPTGGTLDLSLLTLTLPATYLTAAQLVAVNGSGVNVGGLVDWSQLMNVPAGFADGSDDGSGGSSGTVTSFSAGDLSPLFTTSEATATTTPALTFTLSNAAQNSVFAGPATGGTGAPAYRALVAADIPSLTLSKISDAGDAAGKNTGTTAGTVAAGDDARFTDTRTPTDGSVTTAKVQAATLVTAAEGVASNDNDTTIPTTAAVKAYADSVGGGTGNVTKGATFAAGQLLYITNATTGEISGIAGATYNSGNNTLTFNGTVAANALSPTAVSGATANGQFLIGNVTSGNFEKATITQGAGITLTPSAGGLTIAANATGTNTGDQNIIFGVAVAGQNNITANSTSTLLTVAGTGGVVVTTNNTTGTLTIDGGNITGGGGAYETGDVKFILDSASVGAGWALTGANGIAAFTTPDADYKAVMKMAGTVATPTFSPVAGAVPDGHTITFSSATSGVTFMATTNGTDPSRSVGTPGGTLVISGNTTIEVMAYKDGAYLIDSAVASAAYTIDPVPTLTGAEINGTALTLTYSEAVSRGAGYADAHFDLDMSVTGANIGVTYVSGDGTTEHVYTAASAAVSGETVDLDFSGAANSIEETAGYNQDLAAITSAVVTNSTAGGGGLTQVDENNAASVNGYYNVASLSDEVYRAGIFVASQTYTAVAVDVYVGRVLSPGNFYVELWSYDSVSDEPDALISTSASTAMSAIAAWPTFEWVRFSGLSAALTNGAKYCIILRPVSGAHDTANFLRWEDSGGFSLGHSTLWKSADGATWTQSDIGDLNSFKLRTFKTP